MRPRRSPTCSGASARNSGMTSMVRSDATIAATTIRYTTKRARRCADEKRRHVRAGSAAIASVIAGSTLVHVAASLQHGGERRIVEEDAPDTAGEGLAQHDDRDDRNQDGADVV